MEKWALFVSIVAVVISAVSLVRTWKLQEKQEELAKAQLLLAQEDAKKRQQADFDVSIIPHGNSHKFILLNSAEATAKNVGFGIIVPSGQAGPLLMDAQQLLPVRTFHGGQSISLSAVLTNSAGRVFNCKVTWEDPDGSSREKEILVTL